MNIYIYIYIYTYIYIYRLRPIVEWVGWHGLLNPREFLRRAMPHLEAFHHQHHDLLERCVLVKRAIAWSLLLQGYINGDQPTMAHHRAQSDVNSRGCGSYARHGVAIARPRSLATRP